MSNVETMNMVTIDVATFKDIVKENFLDNPEHPMLGIGPSGIGKTECIEQVCEELDIGICEVRLVDQNEEDLLGIPYVHDNGDGSKVTDWAPNKLFPQVSRDGEKGILVLDEFTSAKEIVRTIACRLLEKQRQISSYKLPAGWMIVVLGNGPDDGGLFAGMENTVINRCYCLRVESKLNDWKLWAIRNGVNPTIIAYLSMMPDDLHKFEGDDVASVFPSPRTWKNLSDKLNICEHRNNGKSLSEGDMLIYSGCCIGEKAATRFAAFYKYRDSLIDPEDIMAGKAPTDINGFDTQSMYITIQSLISVMRIKLSDENIEKYGNEKAIKISQNVYEWIGRIGLQHSDYAEMALQDLTKSVDNLMSIMFDESFESGCPHYTQFIDNNRAMTNAFRKSDI